MNKNAIQKYAVWARNELIEQIKQRAFQYGISDNGYGDENVAVIAGRVLAPEEKRQRHEFVVQIKAHGFEQAVEEVAYTWFNRFVALRYMEVNDYLPTHVRVFSDANGSFNPEILKDLLHLDLPGLDKVKVSDLLNANKTEELYRYLLLTQCNALNEALPEMFEKLGSYTEMLLPNNILKPDSVLGRLVTDIPEEDWKDAVQIIGWMYQYYNTEPKQAVFDGLKKNIKITKDKIPAATQLFTPDWIVRYMVENSLGRLWLESHPNDALKANWKYYLDEAEQTPEVAENLRILRSQSPVKSPEDIRLIDPCMGSGHILVYAFDVLMQIYESEGYNPRDAAKLILDKNIYGLDIDRRAYQLAYFALMMKARQYNRRVFNEDVQPQVYHPAGWSDGEEYGSLVRIDTLPPKPELPKDQLTIFDDYERDLRVWNFKRLLAQKYDVVITNPPYMGSSGMSDKLSNYIKKMYSNEKADLYSCFMHKNLLMGNETAFISMITMESWMFLSSFDALRERVLKHSTIVNMTHMPYLGKGGTSLGINFGTAAYVIYKKAIQNYVGVYNCVRYFETDEDGVPFSFPVINEKYAQQLQNDFLSIPGFPVGYWLSKISFENFKQMRTVGDYIEPRIGLITGDNNRFLRFWYEVKINNIGFGMNSVEESIESKKKWFPYQKGGEYRRWYGNLDYVVNWEYDGFLMKNDNSDKGRVRSHNYNGEYSFIPCITWTSVTTGTFACRYAPHGFLFDAAGPICRIKSPNYINLFLGLLSSKVVKYYLEVINPTINFHPGYIMSIPFEMKRAEKYSASIDKYVSQNIAISQCDWDLFETSWDFKAHPLVELKEGAGNGTDLSKWNYTIESAYKNWEKSCNERFNQLKANEEELNRIFIDIYGLHDELTSEVEDKDITIRKADLHRDVKSLISYAVGCIFGRYSLDFEGLAYAGGEWDSGKYKTLVPDKDNVLPICDDEYFDDDILGRFVEFVRVVYGAETLEDNLKFIADAIGGKGTPREVIRNYFLNDFYKDHCKTYQKRPIYWLFDSGKKNGFKALIYMHRYSRDLLAKLRTDYVHEQQERYRTQLSHIATALNTVTGAERAKLLKQQDKLTEQLKEITIFEEKVHHLADQNIEIDLDDGVKKNYELFADVLAKI